jgi:hypothetical protein
MKTTALINPAHPLQRVAGDITEHFVMSREDTTGAKVIR